MTSSELHSSLLRPAVLQILRAAGFTNTKPVTLDTLTDLTARYLLLLGKLTAENAVNNHDDWVPTTQDVRLAMIEVGALRPQLDPTEEAARGFEEVDGIQVPFEDLRGVRAFVEWAQGNVNKEIRRVAGFGNEIDVAEIAAGVDEMEDYVTAIKKKHSKTAEESRYQGTLLGKDNDLQPVLIAGGPVSKLSEWGARSQTTLSADDVQSPATSGISSAPLTPIDGSTPEQG